MATLAICAMQPEFTLQQVLIEVFSAIDTVGLTAGITRQLNTASRVLLILLMYAGRLGSMTFMILLTRRKPHAPVQYPTDKILVGINKSRAEERQRKGEPMKSILIIGLGRFGRHLCRNL